jgi:hypothetical protein
MGTDGALHPGTVVQYSYLNGLKAMFYNCFINFSRTFLRTFQTFFCQFCDKYSSNDIQLYAHNFTS